MKLLKPGIALVASVVCVGALACGETTSTTREVTVSPTPTPPPAAGSAPVLTAPVPESPVDDAQVSGLRPTLTVRNGTSSQSTGTRTYDFQVSDRNDFTVTGQTFSAYYVVVVSQTGVAEDPSGRTSFTPDADLQPATRLYWRARMTQGSTNSDWSAASSFRTRVVGYNRAGELYDPLVGGETIGERVGDTSFVADKGVRINNGSSYIRYRLLQTVTTGEFSMEVEGLRAGSPAQPGLFEKSKVFGMQDGDGDYNSNLWRIDAQYRGVSGNPDNCIQFRAMFGGEQFKIEPSTADRFASVFMLDPARTYFWKGTWNNGFRLEVSDGIGGSKFYDRSLSVSAAYNASRHVAYLGAPLGSGNESASVVGATYRNVWLGNRPRPTSLGSALDAK